MPVIQSDWSLDLIGKCPIIVVVSVSAYTVTILCYIDNNHVVMFRRYILKSYNVHLPM